MPAQLFLKIKYIINHNQHEDFSSLLLKKINKENLSVGLRFANSKWLETAEMNGERNDSLQGTQWVHCKLHTQQQLIWKQFYTLYMKAIKF